MNRSFLPASLLISALGATFLPCQAPGARITFFPPPAGTANPVIESCSADGSVVVGSVSTPNAPYEAVAWDSAGGRVLPGLSVTPAPSFAVDVTPDGRKIAGSCKVRYTGWQYFFWRATVWHDGVPVDLGSAPSVNAQSTHAVKMSEDGRLVAGWVHDPVTGNATATRFNSMGGAQLLGTLPGTSSSRARDLSRDGRIVVGTCRGRGYLEGFRWTSATGMVSLGVNSDARVITADGTMIAGMTPNGEPGYWTQATGWIEIGMPATTNVSGISDDGQLIVGSHSFPGGSHGHLWTPTGGARRIQDVLVNDHGLGLQGLDIDLLSGISGSGLEITGGGLSGGSLQAFRIHLERDGWSDLGYGLAGAGGEPILYCRGTLQAGTMLDAECGNFPPGSLSALVIGFGRVDLPLLGGTLVPSPDVVAYLPAPVNRPTVRIQAPNFPAFAAGTTFFLQQWVLDPTGPQGVTASRAMMQRL